MEKRSFYLFSYQRPRMYLFSYTASNEEAIELYAEYHLGRLAFRLCKQVLRGALVPL
jgi:hypothetical protein